MNMYGSVRIVFTLDFAAGLDSCQALLCDLHVEKTTELGWCSKMPRTNFREQTWTCPPSEQISMQSRNTHAAQKQVQVHLLETNDFPM